MAEDFIEEIYNTSRIILAFQQMVADCRCNRIRLVNDGWKSVSIPVASLCRDIAAYDEKLGMIIWGKLQIVRENLEKLNYCDVADQIESIIECLYEVIEKNGLIDVVEGNNRLFSTRSGWISIENIKNGVNYYSRINPVWEKNELARALYIPTMKYFVVIGCGMGYLPWQMYEVADKGIEVYIFDTNPTMIDYAKSYGALNYIPADKLHICLQKDDYELMNECYKVMSEIRSSELVFYIENFYFNQMKEEIRKIINPLYINMQTDIAFAEKIMRNYFRNHNLIRDSIDDVAWEMYLNQWIIVGGGPSVDENIDYLKTQIGRKTIVAATTIMGKLLENDIEPDIVVVIDHHERTFGHMKGITNHNPVMIIEDSANWRFGELYAGTKFLVSSNRKYYASNGQNDVKEWEVQSTVVSFAIELASFANAISVELIGVDLAYPNGFSHAQGTMECKTVDEQKMIRIPSVDGGDVFTDEILKMYLDDITEQVKKYDKIKFYNLSKHGALIKGCVE